MKILTLHCDYIRFKALKKALKSADELPEKEKEEHEIKEPLVVMTSVEDGDDDKVFKDYIAAIKKTAGEVNAKKIVLYPYAHLSSRLASPDVAKNVLIDAEKILKKDGFEVSRAPFGYYKEFELKVKGHPLSELSKEFHSTKETTLKKDTLAKKINKDLSEALDQDPSMLLRSLARSKLDTSKLKENDHRILGQKLDLFSFNEASPGSTFWHPNGMIIFNELQKFSRELQGARGYQEVYTPQVFDTKLWKVSGHWQHYKDNMFLTEYENKTAGLKPMNCPGHMLLFKAHSRSYKDLPIRFAEYAPLHRMELSGTLAGLLRVIRMHQDDTHIFCTIDQVESEIAAILELVNIIYMKTFGFKKIVVNLSTRPDPFMGDAKDWDKAEEALEKVLKNMKMKYVLKKGQGAFYGPKIDFDIEDSLGRMWQCGTIQLDMQLPKRFELTYTGSDGKEHTPLVIHRAVMGSLERFIGVLLEHLNGNLPVWLSPTQIRIINFTDKHAKATEKIAHELKKELPYARIQTDLESTTVSDKVRQAEILRIPYIIVIGEKEVESKTLAVRSRGEKPKFGIKMETFVKEVKEKIEKRT